MTDKKQRRTEEVQTAMAEVEQLQQQRAELMLRIERLRGFLKYLKGEAQDRDDLKLMDEIDTALSDIRE
jgi:hypothetical protein